MQVFRSKKRVPSICRPPAILEARPNATTLAANELVSEFRRLRDRSVAGIRRWRKIQSRQLADLPGIKVLDFAEALLESRDHYSKFVAFELIANHNGALKALSITRVRKLGKGMASWGDTDIFSCYIAGRAWRCDSIPDSEILAWTKSDDRWWRRAALVATVPLNIRAQGGSGDTRRTLLICRALCGDRDEMIVKALSWALRALVPRDPAAVRKFLVRRKNDLASRVQREVNSKLTTGRKTTPRLHSGGA